MSVAKKVPIDTSMFWWLSFRRPFFIGDEYKVELSEIDNTHDTVKIIITNLKSIKPPETEET